MTYELMLPDGRIIEAATKPTLEQAKKIKEHYTKPETDTPAPPVEVPKNDTSTIKKIVDTVKSAGERDIESFGKNPIKSGIDALVQGTLGSAEDVARFAYEVPRVITGLPGYKSPEETEFEKKPFIDRLKSYPEFLAKEFIGLPRAAEASPIMENPIPKLTREPEGIVENVARFTGAGLPLFNVPGRLFGNTIKNLAPIIHGVEKSDYLNAIKMGQEAKNAGTSVPNIPPRARAEERIMLGEKQRIEKQNILTPKEKELKESVTPIKQQMRLSIDDIAKQTQAKLDDVSVREQAHMAEAEMQKQAAAEALRMKHDELATKLSDKLSNAERKIGENIERERISAMKSLKDIPADNEAHMLVLKGNKELKSYKASGAGRKQPLGDAGKLSEALSYITPISKKTGKPLPVKMSDILALRHHLNYLTAKKFGGETTATDRILMGLYDDANKILSNKAPRYIAANEEFANIKKASDGIHGLGDPQIMLERLANKSGKERRSIDELAELIGTDVTKQADQLNKNKVDMLKEIEKKTERTKLELEKEKRSIREADKLEKRKIQEKHQTESEAIKESKKQEKQLTAGELQSKSAREKADLAEKYRMQDLYRGNYSAEPGISIPMWLIRSLTAGATPKNYVGISTAAKKTGNVVKKITPLIEAYKQTQGGK